MMGDFGSSGSVLLLLLLIAHLQREYRLIKLERLPVNRAKLTNRSCPDCSATVPANQKSCLICQRGVDQLTLSKFGGITMNSTVFQQVSHLVNNRQYHEAVELFRSNYGVSKEEAYSAISQYKVEHSHSVRSIKKSEIALGLGFLLVMGVLMSYPLIG